MSISREQLLGMLPRLPNYETPRLPSPIQARLFTAVRDGNAMIDPAFNRNGGFMSSRFIKVLDPDHDIRQSGNAARRRLWLFGDDNESTRLALNRELAGGESSPVLVTGLGLVAGAVMPAAGVMFSIAATGIEMQRTNQPVRARKGDAVDRVEVLGKRGSSIFHWGAFVLVDPLRLSEGIQPHQWVIHGERHEVVVN